MKRTGVDAGRCAAAAGGATAFHVECRTVRNVSEARARRSPLVVAPVPTVANLQQCSLGIRGDLLEP
ncbi:hypothetical protein RR46_13125 [Papilio xuthus]|uniref:Uncharacterized protein n=1 Tax=Papilio xuthus TaxID=66420 RepID=A0A194PS56_PAPXU|nr:hypothetical protein RR46_13125 [Papilio xuthus]